MSKKKKVGLDFLADLWSGRVANSVRKLWNTLRGLEARIQTIEEEYVNDMTRQEQILTEAAQAINTFGTNITAAIERLTARLESENVSVVDDELVALQQAVAGLGQVADTITPTTAQEPIDVGTPPAPAPDPEVVPTEPVGEVPGNPTAPQPVPAEETNDTVEEEPVEDEVEEDEVDEDDSEVPADPVEDEGETVETPSPVDAPHTW